MESNISVSYLNSYFFVFDDFSKIIHSIESNEMHSFKMSLETVLYRRKIFIAAKEIFVPFNFTNLSTQKDFTK